MYPLCSDGCDSNSVLRFLSKAFVSDGREVCADPSGLECGAIGIEAAAKELDMKEEVSAAPGMGLQTKVKGGG